MRALNAKKLGSERGTTLVELLVAMVAGMVVLMVLFGILDVTAHQTSRTVSRVAATQQARTATARIQQLLNSSCTGAGNPILAGSNADQLRFLTAYGSDPQPIPERHVITYTSGTHGSLVDQTDTNPNSTEYTDPATVWQTLSSTRTLLGDVDRQPSQPVFQYFGYETPVDSAGRAYIDQHGNPYSMLLDGTETMPSDARHAVTLASAANETPANAVTPAADVSKAAEVLVKFVAYPGEGNDVDPQSLDAGATVNDAISLRLTPPANHAGSDTESPCA
jgi:type II secretory pathway pseudopilin PulG